MFKVCHITSVHQRYDIRIFHKECVSLSNAGFDTVLIVMDSLPSETKNNVRIIPVIKNQKSKLQRIFTSNKKINKVAIDQNALIYHFHDPELLPLGLKLKKLGKIVIYDSHEDVPRQILTKTWIPPIFRKPVSFFFEKYENRIIKMLDAIIVPTPHIFDRISKINNNVVLVANYPLINEFAFSHNIAKKDQVCYVGGITKQRGIYQIAEASHQANIKLVLCGPFESNQLKEEILSQYNNIEYLGVVDRQKISEVIQSSLLGFVTLLYTPNHYYSYPIKMFEYMAGGIPIIASHFPLWKTIVEENHCGITVDPENIDEIKNAIMSIQTNPELIRKMGDNGRKIVKNTYNWHTQADNLIMLYNNLLDE